MGRFFIAASKFTRIPVGIHKMIHYLSLTQQGQCQRGLKQDAINFLQQGSLIFPLFSNCKSRDKEGQHLSLHDIHGSLRIKDSKQNELLST